MIYKYLKTFVKINLVLFFTSISYLNALEPSKEIKQLFKKYASDWSNGNTKEIVDNIYGFPCTFYLSNEILIFNSKSEAKKYLNNLFNQLRQNNYSHSTIEGWGNIRLSDTNNVIEMEYKRYLKNGEVMGDFKRTASYIVKKDDLNKYKIFSIITHSPLSN